MKRIQSRLLQITEDGSENTHFATESSDLANGLGIQIENFIKDHIDTSLIVIDTLQRVRDNSGENYSYANDYEQMNKLKEIADQNNIAIIVVHHLRKMADSDPINMVSGSTGIVGAVDGIFVLVKDERASNKAKLHITGRDIKDIVILLEFDQEECLWKMISHDYMDIVTNDEPVISAISQLMQESTNWEGTSTQLLDALKKYQEVLLKPNVLSRTIRNLSEILFNDFGIKYTFRRTNQIKKISLRRVDSDANDGISV